MKKFLLLLILLVIMAAACIGAWKSYNQIKSYPANSLKSVRQAIANHDPENFYKFVDIDAVLNDAAKEILTVQINKDPKYSGAYSMEQMNALYENQLKPEFLSATKAVADEYVAKGIIRFPEKLTETQRWLKISAINSCAIKGISKPVINGDEARSKIEFYNEELKFSFELEIILKKVDGTTWRITEVKGFESYLLGLERAMTRKLESINAPIRNQIAEIFDMKNFNARVGEGDDYGFSKTLKLSIKADVQSDKPLAGIVGNIIIDGRDGREGITPFTIDMAYHPLGLQTFNVDKVLNPFVREDSDVMKHGLKKSEIHIEITEIDYLDGTSLKQLDRLPE